MFIADLHLQVSEPATVNLARKFLHTIAPLTPRLFILGDLVEYWIGDDADDGSLNPFFDDLLALSNAGTDITLMHGNRDFLLGTDLAKRLGATLVTADHLLLANADHPILLMHGDTLCTDDYAYHTLRKTLRCAQWQQDFLAKTITERRAFADDLRRQSQALSAEKEQEIMDVNAHTVQQTLLEHQVLTLLHGHTHKPAQHEIQTPDGIARRFVLGDWHADHAVYAVLENQQLRLETFSA